MKDANPFSAFPFVPVDRVSGQNWQRPRSFAFATTLAHLPLADSEVLQTAHHLPIAIAKMAAGGAATCRSRFAACLSDWRHRQGLLLDSRSLRTWELRHRACRARA
jgi:hypothetical protein